MLSTPVALIVFNRPHLTERTLAAIRAASPTQLFVIADGPRASHPDDAARCAAVHALVDAFEEETETTVHRRFAKQNLGLEANVELGLDWVFSQVDRAIVLEDDCVADPSFFPFATELLDRYQDEPRVWQISGSGLGVPARLFAGDSYAFTAWASVWGWATWADRWQQHRAIFSRDHVDGDAPTRRRPAAPREGLLVTASGRRHFAEAAASDDVVTHGWDKHLWLTMMTEGAFAVSPAVTMVENVGGGADATHTVVEEQRYGTAEAMPFPLCHPEQIALNTEVERELELVLSRVGGRTAILARRLIRSAGLRRAARMVVHSRTTASVTRSVSRLTSRRSRG